MESSLSPDIPDDLVSNPGSRKKVGKRNRSTVLNESLPIASTSTTLDVEQGRFVKTRTENYAQQDVPYEALEEDTDALAYSGRTDDFTYLFGESISDELTGSAGDDATSEITVHPAPKPKKYSNEVSGISLWLGLA